MFSVKVVFFYYCDNFIVLGGKEGIINFSPKTLKDNKNVFAPIISEFRIHNKEVEIGEIINGQLVLEKDINEVKKVTLDYTNRNFSITFSAPLYVHENFNLFKYKMEGFDEEWNSVDVLHRNVQYTNLRPGDYIFKMQARK